MSLTPTPLAGAAAGLHPWDAAEGAEASLADSGSAHPHRHLTLTHIRSPGQVCPGAAACCAWPSLLLLLLLPPSASFSVGFACLLATVSRPVQLTAAFLPHLVFTQAAAEAAAAAALGPPVLVRQMTRVTGLASLAGVDSSSVPLPQPITVRIYMGSTGSTGSGASADTAVAAAQQPEGQPGSVPRLQARLRALERMSRRVAQAQQTIVKGVPTPLPSRQAAADAAKQQQQQQAQARSAAAGATANGGMTSPTAAQRLLGSSHASGLHRLARGSAVNYSPFHHKRPHPADSEGSSSSSSSGSSSGRWGVAVEVGGWG